MKPLLALLLLTPLGVCADLHIDHVTVAGSSLAAMRQTFTAVTGLPTEYGGRHANHATEMALTSFPDGSYIELMAIQPDADSAAVAAQPWSLFLKSNAGPCAFAVRVPDVNAEVARLKSAGVPVGTPERSGRVRPDGTRLAWETASVGSGPRGCFLPFLIRDLTRRERRAYPGGKPTTDRFRGISKVVIGVADLDTAIAQYRRAFGLAAPRTQRDAEFAADMAWFEGTPVVLAHAIGEDSWVARRVHEYGNAPCAFVLSAPRAMTGARASAWFGHAIVWTDESKLGWRLGMEATNE